MRMVVRVVRCVVGLLGVLVALQVLLRLVRRLHPFPIPVEATFILEAPFRVRAQPRRETLARIGLRPGMQVLEVGTGPGYLTQSAYSARSSFSINSGVGRPYSVQPRAS